MSIGIWAWMFGGIRVLKYVGAHEGLCGEEIVSFSFPVSESLKRHEGLFSITVTQVRVTESSQIGRVLTEMNVPGKKNNVTTVMIFIDTVSVFVFRAMSFISFVMLSMLRVEALDSRASILLLWVF